MNKLQFANGVKRIKVNSKWIILDPNVSMFVSEGWLTVFTVFQAKRFTLAVTSTVNKPVTQSVTTTVSNAATHPAGPGG